jgi:hypothetical protein
MHDRVPSMDPRIGSSPKHVRVGSLAEGIDRCDHPALRICHLRIIKAKE